MECQKLTGNEQMKGQGGWVFSQQGVAAEAGFRNVSKHWYKTGTISYEEGLEQLEKGRAQTEDLVASLTDMKASIDGKGNFAMRYRDGRFFRPTEHVVSQMGNWAGTGTWYPQQLLENPSNAKGEQLYARDHGDAFTLSMAMSNGFRRLDQDKLFLWRTRKDGTLRAMLTTEYARVDNRWFIEALAKLIPGGRLSHWRGDQDTLWGNVIIPDTIREEKDSDYGGMLSVGNSEIGERRVSSLPSIFRAICMNGCIWGQKEGKGINFVHRGKIDLDKLFLLIKENLEVQIPLLPQGINRLLGLRTLGWDGVSVKPLFAQVAKDAKLTKRQASLILEGHSSEMEVAPETARTAFGLVAAITRASQKLGNAEWVKLDELGGRLSEMKRLDWDVLKGKAKTLETEEVEGVFATN